MKRQIILMMASALLGAALSAVVSLKYDAHVVYVPDHGRYAAVPVKDLPLCQIAWRIVSGVPMPTLEEIYPLEGRIK